MLTVVIHDFFPHLKKFTLYILSGGAAAATDLGVYFLLLAFGAWYISATIISGVLAFFVAFILHKYVVFQKSRFFLKHLLKYFVVDMLNLCIITGFLYILVDTFSVDPRPAKFIAISPVVLWNFFLYRFFVYV